MTTRRTHAEPRSGLVGLFLHTYSDEGLQYQGQIIGLDGDMTLVQLFSCLSGDPTNVIGIPRADIYSAKCVLYATADDWRAAYEKACRADHAKRRATISADSLREIG